MRQRVSLCAVVVSLAGAASLEAVAASVQASETALSADGLKIPEVTVSAQKRNENLQDVPVSVQVVNSATLTEHNLNSLQELTQILPAVHVSSSDFSNNLTMRGIASGNNPGYDQSVAMFTDDIYHGRSRLSGATFLDLERIEVLKGPQSTFFGNNAIAGALNIVSRKPTNEFDAGARALYGEYGQYTVEGAVGGPLGDDFSARLAVTRNGQRGWSRNITTGKDTPRVNNIAGRLTLAYRPTDNFDAVLKTESSNNRVAGSVYGAPVQWYTCTPPAPFTAASSTVLGQGGCPYALANKLPIGLGNDDVAQLGGQGSFLRTYENVLTVNYTLNDLIFTSVSGYNRYHSDVSVASDPTPLNLITVDPEERYHQFSQEFRLTSATGRQLEYVAGLYYQADKLNFDNQSNVPAANVLGAVLPALVPYFPLGIHVTMPQDEKVYSVFGALKWNATDRLSFNTGVRGSRVVKDAVQSVHFTTAKEIYRGQVPLPTTPGSCGSPAGCEAVVGALNLYGTPSDTPLHQSDQSWMPSAGVQFRVTPQAMAYLTYSRGFKSGGFNATSQGGTAPNDIKFGPEHVNSYELGLKSEWADSTLLMNVGVFRSNYKGLQVSSFTIVNPTTNLGAFFTRNAADSVSQGVELETAWIAGAGFRFVANVTYLDSHYVSFPNASPTPLQTFCRSSYVLPYCAEFPAPPARIPAFADISGRTTDFAPRWSGSVQASYSLQFGADYRFTTLLSPYFSSSYNQQYAYKVGTSAYTRLDARLSLEEVGGRWGVDVIGKNLTDRDIVTFSNSQFVAAKEPPRNVAVQFRYNFN